MEKRLETDVKIKRFIECLLPVTQCNLECHYCYIIQRNHRKMKPLELNYSPEIIGKALSRERWGGTCFISICGAGETLIPKEIVEITKNILGGGNFVNLTNNGTISERIRELLELPDEYLERLHFSFSFHYMELKRKNLLDTFFENVNLVKNSKSSFFVQINLNDEYIAHREEIKALCMEKLGALPQVCATRDESQKPNIKLFTKLTADAYKAYGEEFDSPLFQYTMKNFMVKRTEFCYAGDWAFKLDLRTGILKRCYSSPFSQNIFEDVTKPIKFEAIGKHCNSIFCFNSSHFISLGVIPEIKGISYGQLRNRKEAGWYKPKMESFLDTKLYDSNQEYSAARKKWIGFKNFVWDETLRQRKRLSRAKRALRRRLKELPQ